MEHLWLSAQTTDVKLEPKAQNMLNSFWASNWANYEKLEQTNPPNNTIMKFLEIES